MNYYGFRGKFNDLIKSYLTNRKQFVPINGYDSTKLDITCGVPQGSTLGPLLFLLYINDLQNSLKFANSSHFANATCLTYSNKNKILPRQLEILMEHIANIHNHFTCTSSNSGLFIPQISSTNFGSYSLKYMAPCSG